MIRSLTIEQGLYIAGTPFLNLPYKYDQYSVWKPFPTQLAGMLMQALAD
jgi:hypothetical protein